MAVQRETFYRCVFSSPGSRRVAHITAWDAGEAVQLFRAELRGDGVEEHGTIEVTGLDGANITRGSYRADASLSAGD